MTSGGREEEELDHEETERWPMCVSTAETDDLLAEGGDRASESRARAGQENDDDERRAMRGAR